AEEQVAAEIGQVVPLLAAVHPGGAAVGVHGRVVASGAQVGLHEGGQDALRLLGAGQLSRQHRFGDGDRLLVGSPPHQVGGERGGNAALAVGGLVARGGAPPLELRVGG